MNTKAKELDEEGINWFIKHMKEVQAFSVLPEFELRHIVSQMRSYTFKAGTVIVNQSEPASLFFIIQDGTVSISVKKFYLWTNHVAILESGDFFGECALISKSRRNATVVAETDTKCFILLKATFQHLIKENPLFKECMRAVSSRRKLQIKKAKNF